MSDPQAPTPSTEIHLDLDAEAEPRPEPSPARPRRSWISNSALALAAILIAVAAGVTALWKWLPADPPVAEDAVRDFLDATRDGDVERALALTDGPTEPGGFLVPEALDDRWEINEVAQVSYTENTGEGEDAAVVYAEIEAFDGTRLGTRFDVTVEGETAIVDGGVSRNALYMPNRDKIEINGVVTEFEPAEPLPLLPGLYEFFELGPTTYDFDMEPMLALGDHYIQLGASVSTAEVPVPWPLVTDHGNERLAEAVRAFFDACVERPRLDGCPFTPPSGTEDAVQLVDGAEWTITSYPVPAVTPWSSRNTGYELVTAEPGAVEVEAVVADSAGGTRETTLSCALTVEGLLGWLWYDGSASVAASSDFDDRCRSMVEVD